MSRMPGYQPGVDARRRLRVFLRVPGVRSSAQAQGRGLLRVLLVWGRALPAEAGLPIFLTDGLHVGLHDEPIQLFDGSASSRSTRRLISVNVSTTRPASA